MTPTPAVPGQHLSRLPTASFIVACCVTALGYAWYTNHVWEDYLITFRHSRNLCEGHGLVYQPGEPVHGFTSPLGTLLPAACHLATGQTSYLAALWSYRVLSAAAFAGAGLLLLRGLREANSGTIALIVLGFLFVVEAKAVAFSMNGMETAFMLLFVAWGLLLVVRDQPASWFAFGLCSAGLMWTRPDGCIYIAVLSLAALLFTTGPRAAWFRALLKSGLVCAVLYLPWFLWAWSYYGSPVPNTIRAKADPDAPHTLFAMIRHTIEWLPTRTATTFRPIYPTFGSWPMAIAATTAVMGWFCALYWLLPVRDRLGRIASFCFGCVSVYLSWLTTDFPWYHPPVAVCGLVVLTRGVCHAAERARPMVPWAPMLAGMLLLLLCGERLWVFVHVARQMRVQQSEIENGTRMQVGLWLKDHVRAGERVYLEPLGYIGYFSEAKMLDYPGLVAPEVVQARRERPRDFVTVGMRLRPEWMVLRPEEAERMSSETETFDDAYELMKVFDARPRLQECHDMPGNEYVLGDAVFQVYKRKEAAPRRSGAP
jgi:hypothetical protein